MTQAGLETGPPVHRKAKSPFRIVLYPRGHANYYCGSIVLQVVQEGYDYLLRAEGRESRVPESVTRQPERPPGLMVYYVRRFNCSSSRANVSAHRF